MFTKGRFVHLLSYLIALSILVVTLSNAAPSIGVGKDALSKALVTEGQPETFSIDFDSKEGKAFNHFEKRKGKIVKRSEDEEEEEGEDWGQNGAGQQQYADPPNPDGSASASGSGEKEDESIKDGLAPVKGPYIKLSADGSLDDTEDNVEGMLAPKMKVTKPSYRNWDEYLQNQRSAIKEAIAGTASLAGAEGSVLRPVMHSDDHFRFMDKLFKAKNDRVKAFHALVLYMKEQGKEFRIPQKPTTTPRVKNETGSGTGKPGSGSLAKKPDGAKSTSAKPNAAAKTGQKPGEQKPTDQKSAGAKAGGDQKSTGAKSGKPAEQKPNDAKPSTQTPKQPKKQ